MPRKNSRKEYLENGYYHLYNRGVEKRLIFQDGQDYNIFFYFLQNYLDPKKKTDSVTGLTDKMNLSGEIDLLSFCLMPNHFHFLLRQTVSDGIKKLMQRVFTSYVMYFNKKYRRVGPLFQGVYKAVLVESDEYLLYLSKYIHRNPISLRVRPLKGSDPQKITNDLKFYSYSSYSNYLGLKRSDWIKSHPILDYFSSSLSKTSKTQSYKFFVEETENSLELPMSLCIDSEEEL
ncbi:MAG: hypothetical protein UT63_C0004G0012 [Candidatus Gottesmanbacteria bacterium GW2011_GWC2_39_8]|uniref:Transposase IS200-like domain-containing protein n=1 Tax=Candidatus Gottesmanbacteria bacterium GW2011_GWC2_39_8 TaxID=1618450 RepID=A0A0G0SHN4_9BACT|nr:MAG: hypothetical protein UT63_C0004G0012 [Candidatus Gottesmanbacteria bacterium GW2011_GWC2_39_8]